MERLQARSEPRAHKRFVRLGAKNLLSDRGRQLHFDKRVTFYKQTPARPPSQPSLGVLLLWLFSCEPRLEYWPQFKQQIQLMLAFSSFLEALFLCPDIMCTGTLASDFSIST